jgi:uncharacterized Fe-S cluster protein YjdI
MDGELQERSAFYLTGRRSDINSDPVESPGLRPALLARHRDLTALRYDFPLVLANSTAEGPIAEPLSGLIDRALDDTAAAGDDAARLQAHALKLERELRSMLAGGASGSMTALLEEAARRAGSGGDADALTESARRLRRALKVEGELVDCDAALPARLCVHAWQVVQTAKAVALRKDLDRLILRLNDILGADRARSAAGRAPAHLKASVGTAYEDAFDFEQLSRLLLHPSAASFLSDSRRRRIESTLQVLTAQRFCVEPGSEAEPFDFRFDSCKKAEAAFRARHAALADLVRAMTAAELEIEDAFSGPQPEDWLHQLGDHGLDARDLARFPDYLVCINERELHTMELGQLMEMFARGLPIKVLVQTDDLLPEPVDGTGHLAFGTRSRQIVNLAIGSNEVFVLQSPSSNLARCRDGILKAMRHPGPTLICVFSGASGHAADLPPYLNAAAAMESRAFPAFTYDPSAGPDRVSRLALDDNPQAERDWPVHPLDYEDAAHQRASQQVAFTLIDFVACDRRYAAHFAPVPPVRGSEALAPVCDCLDQNGASLPDRFPSLLMVDRDNTLVRMTVDARLMGEARRCREAWRGLQEMGGTRSSPAARPPAPERRGSAEAASDAAQPTQAPVAADAAASGNSPQAAAKPPAEAENAHRPDEPYIETARCSSCNECIQLNSKMFAYDANQQARIVDPDAGTYRELVEAAESCQVAVIHPGRPRNPAEPGLEELRQRAQPFL